MPTIRPMEQIEIERDTIGHALKESSLCVPVHQRSYAWQEEHVTDLYQDLATALKDEEPEYFLGSIVVVKGPQGRLEVNDGQQRLATSMIFLAAIRDYFVKVGDSKTADLIEGDFLLFTHRRTHTIEPKLILNAQDHDYFVKRVLRRESDSERRSVQPTRESHKRIDKAAKLAAKHVSDVVAPFRASDRADALHKWVDYMEQGARVIRVTVADERTAYIIFETMNDRGLRPSAADLLKNRLYGIACERIQEVMERWQTMTGALETLPDQEEAVLLFLRHMWISLRGPVRSRVLYDKMRDAITTKQAAVDLSIQLASNAPRYAALLNPSHEMWSAYDPTVRKQVDTLAFLGVTQLRPLLLAALEMFPRTEIPKLLYLSVCWSVRCILGGVPSGTLEGYYGRAAFGIRDKAIKDVQQITKEMLGIVPDDTQFLAAVSSARISQPVLARYYLRALQATTDGETEPQYQPSEGREITLEHILPENPEGNWPNVSADDVKTYAHRLGNLALLQATPNSNLGNVAFETKKPELLKSAYSLTREAAKYKEWGPKEIAARQEILAQLAVKTWPLRVK